MATPRRLATPLSRRPVTGGVVVAHLACAPPPAPSTHDGTAPAHHDAPGRAGTAATLPSSPRPEATGESDGRILNRWVTLSAEPITLDVCRPFQPPKNPVSTPG